MVTRDLRWGIGYHTWKLVEHLQRFGVRVSVFIGGGNLATCRLVKRIRGYDLIHVQGSPFGAFGNPEIPIIVTVHTLLKTEFKYQKDLKFLVGRMFERKTLEKAEKIIAVNQVLVDELVRDYHVAKDKIYHIPNGIDSQDFDPPNFGEREDFVMSCGRKVKRKGFDTLQKACEKLKVPLRIYHGELSRRELIKQYKRAAVFVCPSLYETGPLTVMEAMACGCPVICSAIPSVNGLVVDGVTGLLFRVGDVEDLANRIDYLMINESLARRLAQTAYNHVVENFNVEGMAKQTLKIYEELI